MGRSLVLRHLRSKFLSKAVKVVLNGVMSELRFKYDGVCTELQDSRLGFNVCVAPSSVKLSVLEFTEVGVGLDLDRS